MLNLLTVLTSPEWSRTGIMIGEGEGGGGGGKGERRERKTMGGEVENPS